MNTYTPSLNIKSWAEEDRPREKLMNQGSKALSKAELLAILIGSGDRKHSAVELCQLLLSSCDNSLIKLNRLGPRDLMQFNGIGPAKATAIVAAIELGRRMASEVPKKRVKITSSSDAYTLFSSVLIDLPHEEFWILLLDRSNSVLGKRKISQGGIAGTVVDAKLVFKEALSYSAVSIILAHNHPSGNLKPSEADLRLTRKLVSAGQQLDISVLDHLIITVNGYYSFADEGKI